LQARFTHIFVDEFQDTDPLQAELLLLLASNDPAQQDWLQSTPFSGKLFLVGDPKQSIYKFRRADVVLYQTIRQNLEARGVRVVPLSKSFRSLRPIQECVNAAFDSEMTRHVAISPPSSLYRRRGPTVNGV
jgi:ATP-dependent exoDNAse (exonuclease V) beta subunit